MATFNYEDSLIIKVLISCLLLLANVTAAQNISLITWNIRDFGSRLNDQQLDSIAIRVKKADIIAIQEVVINESGNIAAGKVLSRLNQQSNDWNYVISAATNSDPYYAEKYVIFWNVCEVNKVGEPWMEHHYGKEFQREPLLCRFQLSNGKEFTIVTIHSRSKKNNPEEELKYLKYLPALYNQSLIFLGDFNVEPDNSVFVPLKSMGYKIANEKLRTTLKTEMLDNGEYLSRILDNCLIPPSFIVKKIQVFSSIKNQSSFEFWKKVSDHLPLVVVIFI